MIMNKLQQENVRDVSRSFSKQDVKVSLATAADQSIDVCDRVIDDGDTPERGYSLDQQRQTVRLPENVQPYKGSYLDTAITVMVDVIEESVIELTRFGLWVKRISGTFMTTVKNFLLKLFGAENVEEVSVHTEESVNAPFKFEDDEDGQSPPDSFIADDFELEEEKSTEECFGVLTYPDDVFQYPILTPQRSFEDHAEMKWYDSDYKAGSFDSKSYKTQFYMGNNLYLTHWSEVTDEMRESRMNPFGEHFALLCLLSVELAHLVEPFEYLEWFKSKHAGELITALKPFVFDKIPSDVDDVARWLSISMMLLTGLNSKERNETMITSLNGIEMCRCPLHGFENELCVPSCANIGLIGDEEYYSKNNCWKILFENFDEWNDEAFEFGSKTKDQLIAFIEEGAPLSNDKFKIIKEENLFHVEANGDLTAKEVVASLPFWWSSLGQVDVVEEGANFDFNQNFSGNYEFIDLFIVEVASLYMWCLSLFQSQWSNFKSLVTNKWIWRAISLNKFILKLSKVFLTFALTITMFVLGVVSKYLESRFGSTMTLKIKAWITMNFIYSLTVLIGMASRTTMAERVVAWMAIITILCVISPVLVTITVCFATFSLTGMSLLMVYNGLFKNFVELILTFIRSITMWLVSGPLKPVSKFVINARLTMWILVDRPNRGEILKTFWVGDRLIKVDDRYGASDDIDELSISIIELCWGSWGSAMVGSLICLIGLSLSLTVIKGLFVLPLRLLSSTVKIAKFAIGTFIALMVIPDIGLDTFMYVVKVLEMVLNAAVHDFGATVAGILGILNDRLKSIVKYSPHYTPKTIFGHATHMTLPEVRVAFFRVKTIAVLRYSIVRFAVAVENVELPRLLVDQYTKPSKESLKESLQILKDLGWPVNIEVSDEASPKSSAFKDYKGWFMANTNFIQPLRNIRTVISEETKMFDIFNPPVFKHTGEYTSEVLEVESTARYFKNNKTEGPVSFDDDVWEMLHEHFESSRLARTAHVVHKLVKKYSVGFGFMDISGKPKTMSRKVLLKLVEGEVGLTKLFDKTISIIGKIIPVAHVFTKFETLKESKWMNNMVRTIVGVPLAHYSNTSKFSYMQNLRHPFETSPIKVGMPLTGAWFADIWNDHSKRQHHFNGDLKQADSSYSREIFDVIRACRKKGFKGHKDFDQICTMIDIAYDQLMTMPLAFKSNGVVTSKGDGGATGQGNTSLDNSVALVTLYMAAWRRITGKSAKEFQLYNTLSNQADDHILSYDDNNFGWNPKAWMAEFSKMGVTLTDESSSDLLEQASFLAKRIVLDHQNEEQKLKKYGIVAPRFLTCHDKSRLLGKIAAAQPLRDHQARARRLLSYLYLTAHHQDVYLVTVQAIRRLQAKSKRDLGVKIPPYSAILRMWYTKTPLAMANKEKTYANEEELDSMLEALDQFGELTDVTHIHEPTSLEVVLICLSMLPQVFSPRFMTSPALRHIHKLLGERVSWPIELLRRRNGQLHTPGAIATALMKTNYDFINAVDMEGIGSRRSDVSLMLSHWMFTALQYSFLGGNGPKGINRLLRSIDSLMANFYYVVFGQTTDIVEAVGFGYLDTMLLVCCDLIPDVIADVSLPHFPTIIPSDVITRLITRMWRNVQPSAGIDFESIELLMNRPDFIGSKVVIEAPTGVGKSTRMVSKIASLSNKRRIIVIEPRHILVTGLCDYMNKIDPTTGYGASTTGRTPSKSDRVIYTTYQSMVLCGYGKDTDIVIIDEAHIKDPIYKFAVKDMLGRNCTTLLVTATPDPSWFRNQMSVIRVDTAPLWRVVKNVLKVTSIAQYKDQVVKMCRNLGPTDKVLIFMPTTRQCADMLKLLPARGSIISSKHPKIDDKSQFYVSTRVSDAGITLPDVSFVFTMDIEWGVSTEIYDNDLWDPQVKTGHYRIDNLTIKQRQGRTGRTCDGTFFLFEVEGQYPNRITTEKDLLDELFQLLDLPHIEGKLDPKAAQLWDDYKTLAEQLGGGDITPQSLLEIKTNIAHYKNPSEYRRANTQISAIYGQSGTDPIPSFDPLKGENIMPGRDLTDRSTPLEINSEGEDIVDLMQFWGLMPGKTDDEDIDKAKELQVIPDQEEMLSMATYSAPYDDQIPYEDSEGEEFLPSLSQHDVPDYESEEEKQDDGMAFFRELFSSVTTVVPTHIEVSDEDSNMSDGSSRSSEIEEDTYENLFG